MRLAAAFALLCTAAAEAAAHAAAHSGIHRQLLGSPVSQIGKLRRLQADQPRGGQHAGNPQSIGVGHPDCMDLEGLRHAVTAAKWERRSVAPKLPNLDVVILTVCDRHCLEMLFRLWINSIRFARGGDLSKHVVVVSVGQRAYDLCKHYQADHKHQCVLDRACGYPSHLKAKEHGEHAEQKTPEGIKYGQMGYRLALMSKLMWAREVQALNVAPMWMDMDIVVYKSLLPRLVMGTLESSDLVILDEECGPKDEGLIEEIGPEFEDWRFQPTWNENGGLWLVRPTPAGKALMDLWAAGYAQKLFAPDVVLDQQILRMMLANNNTEVPAIKMLSNGSYIFPTNETGQPVMWTRPLDITAHKLNQAYYQSQRMGPWGCLFKEQRTDEFRKRHPDRFCWVPQEQLDHWVVMHMNGVIGVSAKRDLMVKLLNIDGVGLKPPSRKPAT